jgi:hypothetical protein
MLGIIHTKESIMLGVLKAIISIVISAFYIEESFLGSM